MYRLHDLGWHDFQQLCHTITREILGQTVEAFLNSHDGGRDGAFTGEWKVNGKEDLCGPFVIQCKFIGRVNHTLKPSDLSDEFDKAQKLVERGRCRSYLLMTNVGVSGVQNLEIIERFEAVGVEKVKIFGSTWINQLIRDNIRLRKLVPRVYGLGDLSQILDERAYSQARAILDLLRHDLDKVVLTNAYHKSVEAIDKHGFVLLIGEPASGKTTIASLLSLAELDEGDVSILKLDHPEEFTTHWNPDEPSQFFWVDDAFGVTQYEESLVSRWNYILPRMLPMLQSGARIVMTSRDYIYERARNRLKESAFPLLNESHVVIDVHDLSIQEKEQILYNHIKLGNQPRSFRTKIRPFLRDVANHQRFIPETARRLGNQFLTRNLRIDASSISRFVERREQFLQKIIQGLDIDSRAALALIYIRNGSLKSPISLRDFEKTALERLGSNIGGCIDALPALEGSLTRLLAESGEAVWQFVHPTVGDAFAATLAQNPEHIEIFIQGSDPERLMSEVTCGEVDLENAVVVPKSLFPQVIDRLDNLKNGKSSRSAFLSVFGVRGALHSFLASRCSKEFISLYLEHDPKLYYEISHPGLMLEVVPEVTLAIRLHELGLLPDEHRKKFVESVSDYALQGEDASALSNEEIRSLFTESEFDEFVGSLQVELLPRLEDVRTMWEDTHDSSSDLPEDYMQSLLEFLNSLLEEFGEDQNMAEQINYEIELTYQWIEENEISRIDRGSRELGHIEAIGRPESMRSIFDDIAADEQSETE